MQKYDQNSQFLAHPSKQNVYSLSTRQGIRNAATQCFAEYTWNITISIECVVILLYTNIYCLMQQAGMIIYMFGVL